MRCFCCDIELGYTIQEKFNVYKDRNFEYNLCKLCERSYYSQKIILRKLALQYGTFYKQEENEEIIKEMYIIAHNMMEMIMEKLKETKC